MDIDYRALNKIAVKHNYLMSRVNSLMDSISHAKISVRLILKVGIINYILEMKIYPSQFSNSCIVIINFYFYYFFYIMHLSYSWYLWIMCFV